MLTSSPRLSTHRPSPTTISSTVSTAPAQESYTAATVHYALYAIRIVLGLLLCLCISIRLTEYEFELPEAWVANIRALAWSRAGPIVGVGLYLVFRRYHTRG